MIIIASLVLLLWGASIVLLTWTLARAGARSRQADELADAEYRKQAEARVAGLNETGPYGHENAPTAGGTLARGSVVNSVRFGSVRPQSRVEREAAAIVGRAWHE